MFPGAKLICRASGVAVNCPFCPVRASGVGGAAVKCCESVGSGADACCVINGCAGNGAETDMAVLESGCGARAAELLADDADCAGLRNKFGCDCNAGKFGFAIGITFFSGFDGALAEELAFAISLLGLWLPDGFDAFVD